MLLFLWQPNFPSSLLKSYFRKYIYFFFQPALLTFLFWLFWFQSSGETFVLRASVIRSSPLILLSLFAEHGWVQTGGCAALGGGEVCRCGDGGLHR